MSASRRASVISGPRGCRGRTGCRAGSRPSSTEALSSRPRCGPRRSATTRRTSFPCPTTRPSCSPAPCCTETSRCSAPTAPCRRSRSSVRRWRGDRRAREGRPAHAAVQLGRLVEPADVPGRLRPAAAGGAGPGHELVRRVPGRRRRAGRADAGVDRARVSVAGGDAPPDRERPGLRLGGSTAIARSRHRRHRAGVRRLAGRAGHTPRSTWPRLRQPCCVRRVAAVRRAGRRACLFTDQANPTSNKIYEAMGYERLVGHGESPGGVTAQ